MVSEETDRLIKMMNSSHGGERFFSVTVVRPGQKALVYPQVNAKQALQNMGVLHGRGLEVVARTCSNGVAEVLSLADMRSIYEEGYTQ